MKKIKLFLLSMLFALGVNADEQNYLVVQLNDGSSASFQLAKHPKITFLGEVMNIVSETSSMEFNLSDVKNYLFSNVPTSIDEVSEESDVAVNENMLTVSGVSNNTTVRIYNTSGVEVVSATAIAGSCSVSLHSLPCGIYIVTYNNTTFKFFKK